MNVLSQPLLSAAGTIESSFVPNFKLTLKQARMDVSARKYIASCLLSNIFTALVVLVVTDIILGKVKSSNVNPHIATIGFAIFIFFFVFMQQLSYPNITIKHRVDDLNKNLLPALQSITVQLRSGIPLFDVTVNVAGSDYGEVSKEFLSVAKQINGGVHQVEAFEKMAIENPSPLFRSTIWQMVNGMKTGAELSMVLKEIMDNIAEEEIIEIEQYGAVLSPLTMFYMIGAVILPALGVNFLIILVGFLSLDKSLTLLIFWGVYGFIIFFQFMFLNIIKARRPSMLER